MPLSNDKKKQGSNISKLMHEGYPQKQAIAISYSVLGEGKSKSGPRGSAKKKPAKKKD